MRWSVDVAVHNEITPAVEPFGRKLRGAVRKAAAYMEGDIKRSMTAPKSGKVYRRKMSRGRVREHVSSAPGEPPAKDTGRLMNSIAWRMAGPYAADVGSFSVRYNARLEFGGSGIEARPYVRPAGKRAQRMLDKMVREIVREFFR